MLSLETLRLFYDVCLDEGFGAIIWGGAGIWGEDFSIIQFGYTKNEIPNFHNGLFGWDVFGFMDLDLRAKI